MMEMIATRLDNPARGSIIVVHQRLHEDDLTGHLLNKGTWTHISLPLVATDTQTFRIGNRVWTRQAGEAFVPALYPEDVIDRLRTQNGTAFFSAQYQQNPAAAQGELIAPEHIVYFDALPPTATRVTFSIDTAVKHTPDSNYTVVLVIASDGHRHYVVDVLRRRLDMVDMRDAVSRLVQRYGPSTILIEDTSSGPGLARMLRDEGSHAELWPTRGRGKEERLEAHLHMFVQGRVLVQANQPWTTDLVNEWAGFPRARYDDQVDAVSQYLDWCATKTITKPVILSANTSTDRLGAKILGAPPGKGEHAMRPRSGMARSIRRW